MARRENGFYHAHLEKTQDISVGRELDDEDTFMSARETELNIHSNCNVLEENDVHSPTVIGHTIYRGYLAHQTTRASREVQGAAPAEEVNPEEADNSSQELQQTAKLRLTVASPAKGWAFRAFASIARLSQFRWARWGHIVLIYMSVFAVLGEFSYSVFRGEEGDGSETTAPFVRHHVILAIVIETGLPSLLILGFGFPSLLHSGGLFTAMLDCVVWILSIILIGLSFSYTSYSRNEPTLLSVAVFVLATRLNTNMYLNDQIDSIFRSHPEHEEKSSSRGLGIKVQKVAEVINRSKIHSSHKNILIQQLDKADSDQNGILDRLDFLDFLNRSQPLMIQWKTASNNPNEYQALESQLSFVKFAKSKDVLQLDEDDSEESIFSTLWLALRFLFHSQRWLCSLVITGWVSSCFLKTALSFVTGILVDVADDIARDQDDADDKLKKGILGLVGIYLVDQVIFCLVSILNARIISNAAARIQSELVDAVLYSGRQFESTYRPGMLTNAFNAGVAKLEVLWDLILVELVYSVAYVSSALLFLAIIDLGFAFFVLSIPPLLLSFRNIESIAFSASDDSEDSNARLLSRFQNVVSIRKAATVANAKDFVAERVRHPALAEAKKDNFRAGCWGNLIFTLYGSAAYSANALTLVLLLFSLAEGNISSGEFFALASFVFSAITPIETLGLLSGRVAGVSGYVHKIKKILDDANIEDTRPEDNQESSSLSLKGSLVLDQVCFSYSPGSAMVLNGVSATIPAGSFVSVVGTSGSGKSTLLSLLMGTQRCTSGDIYLDGTGISSVPLRSLRDSLGVVFQENFVFDGTIQENILFGYGGSQSDIIDAAKDAGIHDFIMSLPEAYNTVIGKETTVDLSGGQLQRICGISRALARKPKLLLLDEATSALDHVAERQFFDTIERLRDKGLTVISITHHTATTVNADQILVLDQGVIAKSGTFEELTSDANKDGLFARLVEASGRSSSKEGSNDTQGISFASNDGDDGGTGDTVLHLEAEMTPMQ